MQVAETTIYQTYMPYHEPQFAGQIIRIFHKCLENVFPGKVHYSFKIGFY